MSDREGRIGLNEAVFREVNERIESLAETFQLTGEPLDLICECGQAACVNRITMSRAAYEHVRSDPSTFAITPGHDVPDVEAVVERHGVYDIVRKQDQEALEVAEETDPRSA